MKHHLIFTGSGPIVIIHTFTDISEPRLLEKLEAKGIQKLIAFELDGEELRKSYGERYAIVTADLNAENDLRVLDYDGHRILNHFDFTQLSKQKPYFKG